MGICARLAPFVLLASCTFQGPPGGEGDNTPDIDAGDIDVDAAPVELCGNGALDADESCDDGNPDDLDGCSAACAIEPGFECGDPPASCTAVTGVEWGTGQSPDDGVLGGSTTGSPFSSSCAANEVIVGFEGGSGTNCGGAPGLAHIAMRCATLSFAAGAGVTGAIDKVGNVGICNPDNGVFTSGSTLCADGSVLVGVRGRANAGSFAALLEGVCRPLTHVDGALGFGDEATASGDIGDGTVQQIVHCDGDDVVVGISGRSGQVIDQLDLSCAPLETTL